MNRWVLTKYLPPGDNPWMIKQTSLLLCTTFDVGIDLGTPVVESVGADAKSRFTGRIPKFTVQVK